MIYDKFSYKRSHPTARDDKSAVSDKSHDDKWLYATVTG